jgi:hypothetical protein
LPRPVAFLLPPLPPRRTAARFCLHMSQNQLPSGGEIMPRHARWNCKHAALMRDAKAEKGCAPIRARTTHHRTRSSRRGWARCRDSMYGRRRLPRPRPGRPHRRLRRRSAIRARRKRRTRSGGTPPPCHGPRQPRRHRMEASRPDQRMRHWLETRVGRPGTSATVCSHPKQRYCVGRV